MSKQTSPIALRKYKLVFVGEQSVGKTSLINRFMYDTFDTSYQVYFIYNILATIGIDFLSKTMYLDDRTIRLQLWDTAGQERFRSLIPSYIRDSSVAIVVYDITCPKSFESVKSWIDHVKENRGEEAIIILVGNKNDAEGQRVISIEQGEEKAKDFNIPFIETSAKTGTNVKAVLLIIIKLFTKVSKLLPGIENSLSNLRDIPAPVNLDMNNLSTQTGCGC